MTKWNIKLDLWRIDENTNISILKFEMLRLFRDRSLIGVEQNIYAKMMWRSFKSTRTFIVVTAAVPNKRIGGLWHLSSSSDSLIPQFTERTSPCWVWCRLAFVFCCCNETKHFPKISESISDSRWQKKFRGSLLSYTG